jgi:hypothetical protein
MGSEIMINNDENDKLFFNFEKFIINKAPFDQSLNEFLMIPPPPP